jgi:hypothetical protein
MMQLYLRGGRLMNRRTRLLAFVGACLLLVVTPVLQGARVGLGPSPSLHSHELSYDIPGYGNPSYVNPGYVNPGYGSPNLTLPDLTLPDLNMPG